MLLNPTRLQQDTCILIGCCRFRLNDTFFILCLYSLTDIQSKQTAAVIAFDTHIVPAGVKNQGNQLRFGNLDIVFRKQDIGNEILCTEYFGNRCTEIVVSFVGHIGSTDHAIRLFTFDICQLEAVQF